MTTEGEQQPSASTAESSPPSSESTLDITFIHHGTPHTLTFIDSATITDLATKIADALSIPKTHQKFMVTPKLGILKTPFADPSIPLTTLSSKKIILLAPTASDLSSISAPKPHPRATTSPSSLKPATPSRHRDWRKLQDEATYTFHTILPLPYLPNPSRSQRFLERLAADPGIKAAMIKHRFSVGVLTEMNPADHTTHESKTLGLNRNRGEVIELRLRTDAYDGYRDYKIIRDTLCHELAHNVHGEHDRDFWDLCKAVEGEVRRGDWKSGGQAVSEEVFYEPGEREGRDGHVDGGGWEGGEFVLGRTGGGGGGGGGGRGGGSTVADGSGQRTVGGGGMSRRELMAKAAEERMRKQRNAGAGGSG